MLADKQALLRDFWWCIKSPELIRSSNNFFTAAYSAETFAERIEQQCSPSTIVETLAVNIQQLKTKRLGERFEKFWLTAFQLHPDFDVLAFNLPIRSNERTLGECDLIIQQKDTREVSQLELSCKFYLKFAPAEASQSERVFWFGPGLADRLDLRLKKLFDHQLTLYQQPAFKNALEPLGIEVAKCCSILRGRLYLSTSDVDYLDTESAVPINIQTEKGRWSNLSAFIRNFQSDSACWYWLEKTDWFTGPSCLGDKVTVATLTTADVPYAKAIARASKAGFEFWFLVPDDWQQKAAASLINQR